MSRSRSRPALSADLAVAWSIAAVAAVAVLAGMDPSPFSPPLLPGDEPVAPLTGLAHGFGLGGLSSHGAAILGLLLMAFAVGGFLFGLWEAWRGRLSVRVVLGLGIAFQVVAVALPLLLSRDAYSYAMYGRIDAVHHANPYVVTPVHFPQDPVYPFVGPVWRDTTVVYGPAFTLLAGTLARLVASPVGLVWSFKIVAGLAGIGTLLLVAWAARRLAPGRAAFAVALFGWNPVVWAYAVGGGHNDMLVALCFAGALAVLVRGGLFERRRERDPAGRPVAELVAVGLLTLGALVKLGAGPALAVAVVWTVARRPRGRRAGLLAAEVAVVLVLVVAFAGLYWDTANPTLGLAELSKHREWISPGRLLMAMLGGIGERLWGAGGRTAVEAVIRGILAAATLLATALAATAVAHRAASARWSVAVAGAGWAWVLLVTLLASPLLFPWYMAWLLPVAWFLPKHGRAVVIGMSALLAASRAVAEPQRLPDLYPTILLIGHDVIGPLFLVALVWVLIRVRRIGSGASALEDPALPVEAEPAPRQVAPAGHRG